MEKHANTIEYEVYGNYALFSDPVMRVGGEKNKLFNSNLRGIARYYGKHILETHDLLGN